MINKKFTKPPLSNEDKEKRAEEFISMVPGGRPHHQVPEPQKQNTRVTTKDKMLKFSFRVPSGIYEDLKEISYITGISINSICIEILRGSVRDKLKDLKSDT